MTAVRIGQRIRDSVYGDACSGGDMGLVVTALHPTVVADTQLLLLLAAISRVVNCIPTSITYWRCSFCS